ncbi:MAG: undecaprenyl-phosphate galactose phosphotransferase WbaP [Planctomycetota bacterium]
MGLSISLVWGTVVGIATLFGVVAPELAVGPLVSAAVVFGVAGVTFGLLPATGMSPVCEMRQQALALTLAFMLAFAHHGLLANVAAAGSIMLIGIWLTACICVPIVRFAARAALGGYSWWGRPALVIGAGPQGQAIYDFLVRSPQRGLRPIGLVDDPHRYWDHDDQTARPFLGSFDEIPGLARKHDAFWAIVESSSGDEKLVDAVANCCGIENVIVLPAQTDLPSLWVRTYDCGGLAGIYIREKITLPLPRAVKRSIDVVVAGAGLLVLSPLFALFALLITRISPGPVFFGHTRIGRNGKRFKAWKFRSMVPGADKALQSHLDANPALREEWKRDQKLKDDPRIIPKIGNLLRRTSLDELPQLWNVFVGDMSLIGPRPIVDNEVVKYERSIKHYLRVRPGISGLWQISGRNNTTYEERVRLDDYYVRNWSPWLDLYILLRTVRTVLLREGAF